MQLLDIGPRGFTYSGAVATKSFTPLYDRAAKVTDVRITNPSATDSWVFSLGGRELFRTRITAAGYQNPFGNVVTLGVHNRSWLPYVSDMLGMEICVPVPNGQTLTVASAAGATADISIEYKEVSIPDIQVNMINHYQGNRFIHPLVQFATTAIAGIGPTPLDTQVASSYVPSLLHGVPIPPGWKINLLAMWCEPISINTFSGAANHVSNTVALQVKKNGQVQWTRDNTGVPIVPVAAAAGSANVNRLADNSRFNSFQLTPSDNNQGFDPMISLVDGDNFEIDVVYAGDYTGAPVFNHNMVLLLADVTQVNP